VIAWSRDRCLGASFHRFRPRGSAGSALPRHAGQSGRIVEPELLRIQETAKLLKVSKWTVYRWIEEGRLRATKIGQGSLRVFRTSVRSLIGDAEVRNRGGRAHTRTTVTAVRKQRRPKKAGTRLVSGPGG
jgi:excisionase family DNA binding protein